MHIKRGLSLAAVATAIMMSFALPANATVYEETRGVVSDVCMRSLPADKNPQLCQYTVTTTLSAPLQLEAADIEQIDGLAAADKAEMLESVQAGVAVSSKHYSQALTGLAWTTTQNGTFYYNGSRAWVTQSYLGYTGSHSCFVNFSAGFSLSLQGCGEWGNDAQRSLNQSWYVRPLDGQVGWTAGSTVHVHGSGHISW